ncbi:MAG: hypothetical protein KDE31_16375, partial [Caldilineaceae bacterium]|nr:hypothetical protein [Caldilineaceae bacterium]
MLFVRFGSLYYTVLISQNFAYTALVQCKQNFTSLANMGAPACVFLEGGAVHLLFFTISSPL